jgi:hypothetical protein
MLSHTAAAMSNPANMHEIERRMMGRHQLHIVAGHACVRPVTARIWHQQQRANSPWQTVNDGCLFLGLGPARALQKRLVVPV